MNRFVVAVLCLGLMSVVQQVQAGPFGLFGRSNCSSGSCGSDYGSANAGSCSSGQCAVPLAVERTEATMQVANRQVVPQVVEVDQGLQWNVSHERSSGATALIRSYYASSRRAIGSRSGVIASARR